jgi:hypothetical protein
MQQSSADFLVLSYAVTRFARATGDMHSLSAVDLRLMALARTLEVAAHGDAHLRVLPAPPRPLSRRPGRAARALPGWDAQGGEWAAMDALAEQEDFAAEAARNAGAGAPTAESSANQATVPCARSRVAQRRAAITPVPRRFLPTELSCTAEHVHHCR